MPDIRTLRLAYDSIASLPGGSNEVRVYHDDLLDCDRVGKRFDVGMVEATVLPEASTLQAIRHPNVIEVVSAARVDGYSDPLMNVIEVITPYLPRGSITDALLRGETFCGPNALAIVRSALLGLRELHVTHRILHRDIKSGNILLTDPPIHALVADLGVAGRMDDAGGAPAVRNPTLYSPPEFSAGRLSVASDLYSLALVLNELIGGRFPYEAYTRDEVVTRLADGRNPLRDEDFALPIWAPSRLRRIYSKATHVNPMRRFRSAQEMEDALARLKMPCWRERSLPENSGIAIWEVRRSSVAGAIYIVRAEQLPNEFHLSIKRETASGLRRPAGHEDISVPSLTHRDAQRFFDRANSLAL